MPSFIRTVVIVSVVLSLTHSISGGGTCCPGDKICSGCWMCEGSTLRDCWDQATSMPSKCEAISDLQEKAACHCKAYAAVAKCWSAGTCCTEYAPTLAVATDLCNLASYPSDQLSSWKLEACVKEAARVADAIWHNDSGVDVPKAQSHIQPFRGTVSTATAVAQPKRDGSYAGSYADPPPPQSSQNNYHKNKSTSSNPKKSPEKENELSWAEKEKDRKWTEEQKEKKLAEKRKKEKKLAEEKKKEKKLADKKHKQHYNHQNHHHEKQYAQRGRGERCGPKQKRNYSKRASYTTLDVSAAEMQDMRLGKRSILCGIDFQGVQHPQSVPELVQKAYDEI